MIIQICIYLLDGRMWLCIARKASGYLSYDWCSCYFLHSRLFESWFAFSFGVWAFSLPHFILWRTFEFWASLSMFMEMRCREVKLNYFVWSFMALWCFDLALFWSSRPSKRVFESFYQSMINFGCFRHLILLFFLIFGSWSGCAIECIQCTT